MSQWMEIEKCLRFVTFSDLRKLKNFQIDWSVGKDTKLSEFPIQMQIKLCHTFIWNLIQNWNIKERPTLRQIGERFDFASVGSAYVNSHNYSPKCNIRRVLSLFLAKI